MPDLSVTANAAELHRTAFVADGHADTIGRLYFEGGSLAAPTAGQQVDLERLVRGGVGLQVLALCPVWGNPADRGYAAAVLGMLDTFYREQEANPSLTLVTTAADLPRLRETRQADRRTVGVLLAIEGGEALEGNPALLRMYHRLGVRLLTLTHNGRNALASGVAAADPTGLTPLGRQIIREMNRLGMVVDVSHLAPAGFWQVLELSARPVVASHSNARALCDHRRNLTDEQARALAERGGVIGVTYCPPFLRKSPDDEHPVPTYLTDVLDQLDYLVNLVGPDHVALGSDFDGIPAAPGGLEDVSQLPNLTLGLLARGYAESTIRAILGENLFRILRTGLPPD